jgi:inosose dehydratase
VTRREWLLSAAAGSQARAAAYRPLLGAQIYVWTQQKAAVEDALAGIRRAGYDRLEMMAQFFEPALLARTTAALRLHKLELCAVYNGGPMHDAAGAGETIAKTVALAEVVKPLGARAINFNPNPLQEPKSDPQLAYQAEALNRLGAQLKQRGFRLTLHQHAPEMRDNAREWRYALRHTDPALVWFCVDVDWIKRGGQDPMTLLPEAGKRISSIHLRSARSGVWMEEFGDGDIDYRPVAAYLKEIGYQGFLLVELAYEKATNPTRPLEEDLRRSRLYAEKIFFG